MALHQCDFFKNNPRLVYEHSIRIIAKYLASTSTYVDLQDVNRWITTRRVVYKPDIEKCIECYTYAKFSSGWSQSDADNAEIIMSRTEYVIMYAGCQVLCCGKLQT